MNKELIYRILKLANMLPQTRLLNKTFKKRFKVVTKKRIIESIRGKALTCYYQDKFCTITKGHLVSKPYTFKNKAVFKANDTYRSYTFLVEYNKKVYTFKYKGSFDLIRKVFPCLQFLTYDAF